MLYCPTSHPTPPPLPTPHKLNISLQEPEMNTSTYYVISSDKYNHNNDIYNYNNNNKNNVSPKESKINFYVHN